MFANILKIAHASWNSVYLDKKWKGCICCDGSPYYYLNFIFSINKNINIVNKGLLHVFILPIFAFFALSIMCPVPSLFTQRMGTKSEKHIFNIFHCIRWKIVLWKRSCQVNFMPYILYPPSEIIFCILFIRMVWWIPGVDLVRIVLIYFGPHDPTG